MHYNESNHVHKTFYTEKNCINDDMDFESYQAYEVIAVWRNIIIHFGNRKFRHFLDLLGVDVTVTVCPRVCPVCCFA